MLPYLAIVHALTRTTTIRRCQHVLQMGYDEGQLPPGVLRDPDVSMGDDWDGYMAIVKLLSRDLTRPTRTNHDSFASMHWQVDQLLHYGP
jgi:hypothetical protein